MNRSAALPKLLAALAVAAALGLAACGSDYGDDESAASGGSSESSEESAPTTTSESSGGGVY